MLRAEDLPPDGASAEGRGRAGGVKRVRGDEARRILERAGRRRVARRDPPLALPRRPRPHRARSMVCRSCLRSRRARDGTRACGEAHGRCGPGDRHRTRWHRRNDLHLEPVHRNVPLCWNVRVRRGNVNGVIGGKPRSWSVVAIPTGSRLAIAFVLDRLPVGQDAGGDPVLRRRGWGARRHGLSGGDGGPGLDVERRARLDDNARRGLLRPTRSVVFPLNPRRD